MKLFRSRRQNQGYVLTLTAGLGLAMLMMGLTAAMYVQTDRSIAQRRQQNGTSLSVAEGAVDRVLTQLSRRDNSLLLSRPYDPINPKTGRQYLGSDGIPNSGDEGAAARDRWTNHDPTAEPCFVQAGATRPNIALSGTIGSDSSYRLLAYRYHPEKQQGSLLVEGRFQNETISAVLVTITVKPDLTNFPGVMAMNPKHGEPEDPYWDNGIVGLRNRVVLGSYGNIYYDPEHAPNPSLNGISRPGDANRANYLDSMFANPAQDGGSGQPSQVSGNIFACRLTAVPYNTLPPVTPSIGKITNNRTLTGTAGTRTVYWIDGINLKEDETLTVDTTAGPVSLYMNNNNMNNNNPITLKDNAQIRNIRTDGRPARVGDLRIVLLGNNLVQLKGHSCISQAFLWVPIDELRLETTGPGCSSGRNTNFEGVVWAEAVLSSKIAASHRNIEYLGYPGMTYDTTVTGNNNSGIYVPDDLSSMDDLLAYVDLPVRYWIMGVVRWQQVRL
jgi:hypothetical protein